MRLFHLDDVATAPRVVIEASVEDGPVEVTGGSPAVLDQFGHELRRVGTRTKARVRIRSLNDGDTIRVVATRKDQ